MNDGLVARPDAAFAGVLLATSDPRALTIEQSLDLHGVPVALESRHAWRATLESRVAPGSLAAAIDTAGQPAFAVGVHVLKSRAAPGHHVWRVDRLGLDVPTDAVRAALSCVCENARQARRVLRVEATVATNDDARRLAIGNVLTALGFRRVPNERTYARTIALELEGKTEAELFAGLPKNTRRNVRLAERRGLVLRPIDDASFAPRMDSLISESMARTGGSFAPPNWAGVIELSQRLPSRSRLVGMFVVDGPRKDDLLALAWGCQHGDYAHYDLGASARDPDFNAPLAYTLLWDLIAWAKANGASWFDFGGVTAGTNESGDALGGISDFKRHFSQHEVRGGEEWAYEPRPTRARLARAASAVFRRVSGSARRIIQRTR